MPDTSERLARIETRLDAIQKDVDELRSLVKWVAALIGGAILTAFANFVLNGGLILHAITGGGQ